MPYKDSPEQAYEKALLKQALKENPGDVETSVRKFVKQTEITDPKKLALAEMAYALARVLDYDAGNSSAGLSKELREILESLSEGNNDLNDLFKGPM